jgi:hypothetical protein
MIELIHGQERVGWNNDFPMTEAVSYGSCGVYVGFNVERTRNPLA